MTARYLAKLGENNIIIGVAKIGGTECCDKDGNIDEAKAIAYRTRIDKEGHSNWKLACDKGSIRANPPEIGGYYDNGKDVFVRKKPNPKAVLNDQYQWEFPPVVNQNLEEPEEYLPEPEEVRERPEGFPENYVWSDEQDGWVAPIEPEE